MAAKPKHLKAQVWRAVFFCAMLGAALVGVGSRPSHAENILHRAIASEPATLDPQRAGTPAESAVAADLFEGLLAPDAADRPTLGLADSWVASANGKRYTFHLRSDLTWSDGNALTSAEVVDSFRRLMNPKTASRFAALFTMIKSAEAVRNGTAPPEALGVSAPDASTIIFDLEAPAPYFLSLLTQPFAAVVPVETIAADAHAEPGMFVSNGAFKLEAWKPGDRIALTRNPRFHDAETVRIDRVVYYPLAGTAATVVRYRAGEFDIDGDFPETQFDALRRNFPNDLKLDQALISTYLAVNTAAIPDHRVRRALSLALDRQVLTANVLRGGEQPAASLVPPATANYAPATIDFVTWKADERLAEARRLLAEAGFDAKHALRVTMSYAATQETRLLAVMIADMWKQVGVETAVKDMEGGALFADLEHGAYDLALLTWVADVNDAANFLQILESENASSNFGRYNNHDFDENMARAAETGVTAERAKLLHNAEAVVMAEQPVIPLYFGVNRNMVAARVAGWVANPSDVHLSRYLAVTGPHG